jgi:hypothetical protein
MVESRHRGGPHRRNRPRVEPYLDLSAMQLRIAQLHYAHAVHEGES